MVDYRHWAHAYLMYMLLPLVLMYPLFLLIGTVFSQPSLIQVTLLYLLSAAAVLLYRITAAHAHDELWREAIAVVAVPALFFLITYLWGIIGIASAGYLVYNRFTGTRPQRTAQHRQPRQS